MEASSKEIEFVCGDVNAVGVGAYVRIVAQAWSSGAVVIGCALAAIILRRDLIDIPPTQRTGGLTHSQVEMVGARKARARTDTVKSKNKLKPALRVGIKEARGIGYLRSKRAGADDRRRVSIERVEVGYSHQCIPCSVKNT